jgi:hypothetical protein
MNKYQLPISRILSLETPERRFRQVIGVTVQELTVHNSLQRNLDRKICVGEVVEWNVEHYAKKQIGQRVD